MMRHLLSGQSHTKKNGSVTDGTWVEHRDGSCISFYFISFMKCNMGTVLIFHFIPFMQYKNRPHIAQEPSLCSSLLFDPSQSLGTMVSADSLQFSHTSLHDLLFQEFSPLRNLPARSPPIKSKHFHLMSPPHLHRRIRVVLDFVLFGKLVLPAYALYVISVRQCETLPNELVEFYISFRFRLTADTLLQYNCWIL